MKNRFGITKQQRENLVEAIEVMWPSIPPENISRNLAEWRDDLDPTNDVFADDDETKVSSVAPDCKTIACFGGWCAWWPSFRAQGVFSTLSGIPSIGTSWLGHESIDVSEELFGYRQMFYMNGHADIDQELENFEDLNDKQIVQARLQFILANSYIV